MIVAIERIRPLDRANIVELHCPPSASAFVAQSVHRLTGIYPIPKFVDDTTIAIFSDRLNLEEGCALLRLILNKGKYPEDITIKSIKEEIALEHNGVAV